MGSTFTPSHAAILNRLVSLRSFNAELQERAFGQANAICRATSNYHPEHIISNVVVRYQVEANRQKQRLLNTQNSAVSDLGQALPTFTNTVLPKNYVVQAHLERVSDFLLQGYGVWWKRVEGGIEFLDGKQQDSSNLHGPTLHHFQSSNMQGEIAYLEKCWIDCLEKGIEVPLEHVRRYGDTEIQGICYRLQRI